MGRVLVSLLRTYSKDDRGQIAMIFGFSLVAILALAGGAISMSLDSRAAKDLQNAADSAALGGATAFINSAMPKLEDRLALATKQANALAQSNVDYKLTTDVVTAASKDAYGQSVVLKVDLAFKPTNPAASLTGRNGTIEINRHAKAKAVWGFPLCILTLSTTGPGLSVSGDANFLAKNCIVWSNSKASDGMTFTGGTANALSFCSAGGVKRKTEAKVKPLPETKCKPLPIPMAGFAPVTTAKCDFMKFKPKKKDKPVISPGTYCGGFDVKSETLTFEPGVYHIRDGKFRFHSKGDIAAEGVTFLIGDGVQGLDIKSDTVLKIKAPATGPTAGIAIGQLPSAKDKTKFKIDIAGSLNVEGVIYTPDFDIKIHKKSSSQAASPYLQMVANTVELKGDANLQIDFDEGKTTLPIVIEPERYARLVE